MIYEELHSAILQITENRTLNNTKYRMSAVQELLYMIPDIAFIMINALSNDHNQLMHHTITQEQTTSERWTMNQHIRDR